MLLVALLLGACSNVYVYDPTGEFRVEKHYGIVSVSAPPGASVQAVDIQGGGFVQTPNGFVLGYYDGSIMSATKDCHIVLWVRSESDIEKFADVLKGTDNVCLAGSTGIRGLARTSMDHKGREK